MARAGSRLLVAMALPLAIVVDGGCKSDPAPPDDDSMIGASPLRRLSNDEYLNALSDLFPAQHPTLPKLPNDTLVAGFENDAQVQKPSDVRIARYETIANLYAEAITADTAAVHAFVGCDWKTPSQAADCTTHFLTTTGSKIFRRPLEPAELDRFGQSFRSWQMSIDFEAAVRLTLSTMLQSPQFLYRAEPIPIGVDEGAIVPALPYEMASRLSFFLWESVPDDDLLAAASRDELKTADQVRAQADRMLHDDRARRVLWSFHRQWLGLDRILEDEHLVRTPDVDPSWSATSQLSSEKESQLFVENVLMQGGSFKDLLTSKRAWVDREMARIYGIAPVADAAWHETALPENERAGLLTRAAFLAAYSHRGGTSPPLRGNAVELRLLCQLPVSPPPGVDLSMPKAPPGAGPKTNRMLFEARTSPGQCQACHVGLNGFGFGFESYSASGAYQSKDHGLPVDATGHISGTDVDRAFDGPLDLSNALAESRVVRKCATEQWVRYALGRAPVDTEDALVDKLTSSFMDDGSVQKLLMDIAVAPSFRKRRVGGMAKTP
jgi:hypothetical protein